MATSFNNRVIANDENQIPNDIRPKPTIPYPDKATRRIALSTVNENIPQKINAHKKATKKLEVAKQQTTYETVVSSNLWKPSFTVFEDEPSITATKDKSDSPCTLSENVTKLYRHDVPVLLSSSITSEEGDSIYDDSPMALDLSRDAFKSHSDTLFHCLEYDAEIYKYLRDLERKFRPTATYMRKQPDITSDMRSVLVDWLVDVGESYKMETSTVYLAVSYIDRFLSHMSVLRSKLQLVGTASLFVASKYEEIYPPELKEFVYVTDDTYTKKQVLRMEHLILKVLAFNLSAPTAYDFLQRYCLKCSVPYDVKSLAEYICELSLLHSEPYLAYLPSEVAASSLCLALYTMGNIEPWESVHIEVTGYKLENMDACIKSLIDSYSDIANTPYRAITEKYSSPKYHGVSKIAPPQIMSQDKEDKSA